MATNKLTSSQSNYARVTGTATHFSVSKSTIWNWTKTRSGFPQPFRAGERVTLFDLGAIEAFLKSEGDISK